MKNCFLLLLCPLAMLSAWEEGFCDDENCPCHERRCLYQEIPTDNVRLHDEAYWPTKNQDPLIDALTK